MSRFSFDWTPGCRARLKELRIARGLSQKRVSLACGLSHARVGQMESPTNPQAPSMPALSRLADELGVTARYLLGVEGARP